MVWSMGSQRVKQDLVPEQQQQQYEPVIPLLGIYPEKIIIQKGTCTPMFTAALLTIDRTWKQSRCPSTDEWIKKMWYIHTMNITQL